MELSGYPYVCQHLPVGNIGEYNYRRQFQRNLFYDLSFFFKVAADLGAFFQPCIRTCGLVASDRKYELHFTSRTTFGRKVQVPNFNRSNRHNSADYRTDKFYFLPKRSLMRCQRCRVCLYVAGFLYQLQRRRNSVDFYSGSGIFHRRADYSGHYAGG